MENKLRVGHAVSGNKVITIIINYMTETLRVFNRTLAK